MSTQDSPRVYTRLQGERLRRGLTQRALAREVALDPSAVSNFEARRFAPVGQTARRIERVLNVPAGRLGDHVIIELREVR